MSDESRFPPLSGGLSAPDESVAKAIAEEARKILTEHSAKIIRKGAHIDIRMDSKQYDPSRIEDFGKKCAGLGCFGVINLFDDVRQKDISITPGQCRIMQLELLDPRERTWRTTSLETHKVPMEPTKAAPKLKARGRTTPIPGI